MRTTELIRSTAARIVRGVKQPRTLLTGGVRGLRAGKLRRLVAGSGIFDERWYLSCYPDLVHSGIDPISHYLRFGAREGRDPSPLFQTQYYLSRNPDVAAAQINPLVHYIQFGDLEGRAPNPLFDVDWYRRENPVVMERGQNALAHYVSEGAAKGCNPNPLFDTEWYRTMYPEVAGSQLSPLAHYLTTGASKGYKTSPIFVADLRLWEKRDHAGAFSEAARANPLRSRVDLLNVIDQIDRGRGLHFFEQLKKVVCVCGEDVLQEVDRTLDATFAAPADRRTQQPLVSVIMPVFNRSGFVADAISSVLNQSYENLELIVCDDGSTDDTWEVCKALSDGRLKLLRQANAGAAAARNRCLEAATGEYIAYLDSDNLWHPDFLRVMIQAMLAAPGQPMAYANYFDISVDGAFTEVNTVRARDFDYELQLKSPFVDLNSIVHHRALYQTFGGFDERLQALQDYDLIARYAWPRDALHVPLTLNIYQRIAGVAQISRAREAHARARALITDKVGTYYASGVDVSKPDWVEKVTVLSWDISRNHFAKAYSVADALSPAMKVQLISFRFFEEAIFAPIAEAKPPFELKSFEGAGFPDFLDAFCNALEAVSGDVIYAVKPRLPSFGLALLANYRTGAPIFLEANDLETMMGGKRLGKLHRTLGDEDVLARAGEASVAHSLIWSQYLDALAAEMPLMFSHNENLNRHYGSRCLFMRNIKDEGLFDPARFDRSKQRRALGLSDDDRVILFGGMVGDHKGVDRLVNFVRRHEAYRLLVVGSMETPELKKVRAAASDRIMVFPTQIASEMARLNHLADAVILWLDPREAVGHYQMPYKFTDAIAMGTPVVATPISDLARLSNIVWHVPYGDYDVLHDTLQRIFGNDAERARRCEAGRRLYQKEFTYRAVRQNLALACHMSEPKVRYAASERFADLFVRFCETMGADTRRLKRLLSAD